MATHLPYAVSDVEVVFRRNPGARDWDDLIEWLREEGEGDNELRADEVNHMIGDFERLKDRGTAFTTDAQRVHDELRRVAQA